jgi:tetratricopeptide (TPR) repeat protein
MGCSSPNVESIEQNQLGVDFYHNQEFDKALNAFKEATIKSEYPTYYINEGLVLIALEEYEEALECFKKAREMKKGQLEQAYYGAGLAFLKMGNYEEALEYFEQTLLEDPKHLDGYLHKAYVLQWIDRYEEALQTYNEALDYYPEEMRIWIEKGRLLNYLERYEEALQYFSQAIDKDGAFGETYNQRGLSYLYLNQLDEAKDDFDRAVELFSNEDKVYLNYGLYYEKIGDINNAFDAYSKAIEIEETKFKGHFYRGLLYYKLGEKNKALEDFEMIIVHQDKTVLLYLGKIYTEQGRYEEAAIAYENYLISKPSTELYNELGLIYIELKQYEKALDYFFKAHELESNDLGILFNIGITYGYLGDYGESKNYMEKILDINPTDQDALKELIFIHTRL